MTVRHREMTRMIREIVGPAAAYRWWFEKNELWGGEEPIIYARKSIFHRHELWFCIRSAYEEYRARVLL